ncbi:MAG: hypothetical protein QXU20_02065 [Candidatus Woesearchaeota archaeon]
MRVNEKLIIKTSFLVSLIGLLLIIILFELSKPKNNDLIISKIKNDESEEILISGKIKSVLDNNSIVKIKLEVCDFIDAIIFKESLLNNFKNYSFNDKNNITLSGRFDGKKFIVSSIK